MRLLLFILSLLATILLQFYNLESQTSGKQNVIMYNYKQEAFNLTQAISKNDFNLLNVLEEDRRLRYEPAPADEDCLEERLDKAELIVTYKNGLVDYENGLPSPIINSNAIISIEYRDNNGLIYTELCTLNIKVDQSQQIYEPEVIKVIDVLKYIVEDDVVEFLIVNISGTHHNDDFIDIELRIERSVKPVYSYNPTLPIIEILEPTMEDFSSSPPNTNNLHPHIDFKWKLINYCESDEIPIYQLQLLRLYNFDKSTTSDPKEINTRVNWDNALTIEVDGTKNDSKIITKTISVVEGTGYYIWRLRPIGDFYRNHSQQFNENIGGLADNRNWGPWIYPIYQNGTALELQNGTEFYIDDPTLLEGGFFYEQFDSDKNWAYDRIFTENGDESQVTEGITYYDNLNKQRQSQYYSSEEESKVVSQTVYDYSGRPAIQTLSVPFDAFANGPLGYQSSFALGLGNIYSASDFDNGIPNHINENRFNPNPVIYSDLQNYYDGSSTDNSSTARGVLNEERVPSSAMNSNSTNFYPYVRTLYDNTPQSNVRSVSGVGEALSIGSNSTLADRTIRLYGGSASEEELLPLLGDETPRDNAIRKEVSVDQNGVNHISYFNNKSQIIATALALTPSSNSLSQLDNTTTNEPNKEKVLNKTITHKIDGYIPLEDGHMSSEDLIITEPTTIILNYDLTTKNYQIANLESCIDICITCNYNIGLDIINTETLERPTSSGEGCELPIHKDFNYVLEKAVCTGVTTLPSINCSFDILEPGVYRIQKVVRTNPIDESTNETIIQKLTKEIANEISDNLLLDPQITLLMGLLNEVISGDKTIKELNIVLESASNSWTETTIDDIVYFTYTPDCCDQIRIRKYNCDNCPSDFENNPTPDFESLLFDKVEEFLLDNGFQNNELPDRDINDYFYRDSWKTDGLDKRLYGVGTNGKFNELIKNMLAETDPNHQYNVEDLCVCFSNAISVLFSTGLDLSQTGNSVFRTDFDFLDQFLKCSGTCYDGFTSHPYTDNNYTVVEGYLTSAYKYYFFDGTYGENLASCLSGLEVTLEYNGSEIIGLLDDNSNHIGSDCSSNPQTKYGNIYSRLLQCITVDRSKLTGSEFEICGKNINDVDELDLNEIKDCLEKKCEDECDSKYDLFVRRLIKLYHEKGYSVQGDKFYESDLFGGEIQPIDPNSDGYWDIIEMYRMFDESEIDDQIDGDINSTHNKKYYGHTVSIQQIHCMASALVENCKTYCDITISTSPVEIGTQAQRDDMQKVFTNTFELDIPSDNPGCTGYDIAGPATVINPLWYEFVESKLNELLQNYIVYNQNIGTKTSYGNHYGVGYLSVVFDFEFWEDEFNEKQYTTNTSSSFEPNGNELESYNINILKTFGRLLNGNFCFYFDPLALEGTNEFENEVLYNSMEWAYLTLRGFAIYEGDPEHPLFNPRIIFGYDNQADTCIFKLEYETNYYFDGFKYINRTKEINLLRNDFGVYSTPPSNVDNTCNPLMSDCVPTCTQQVCFKWVEYGDFQDEVGAIEAVKKDCNIEKAHSIKKYLNDFIFDCAEVKSLGAASEYRSECETELTDNLNVNYDINYYHYTLFYYDRAGNLYKTIQPKGVDLRLNATRSSNIPNHSYMSVNKYDSQNNLIWTKEPDIFIPSEYFYSYQNQLMFSISGRQLQGPFINNLKTYSYSQYDDLGRVIETGESNIDLADVNSLGFGPSDYSGYFYAKSKLSNLSTHYSSMDKQMFIQFKYGFEVNPLLHLPFPFPPQGNNLINRLNYVIRDADGDELTTHDKSLNYYSYDLHGNTEWIANDVPAIEAEMPFGQRFISMVNYQYDLISGNIKNIHYNYGEYDSYSHLFEFDDDQRLSQVKTSRFGKIWDLDNKYIYAKHGPLKRTEIGEDKIQGVDYTYNINGWLKGINHSNLAMPGSLDPGNDGISNSFAFDAFGSVYNYYKNDYYSSNNTDFNYLSEPSLYQGSTEFYNGTISIWNYSEFDILPMGPPPVPIPYKVRANVYDYDALYRIRQSNQFNFTGSNWALNPNNDYRTTHNYDQNGNLLTLTRNINMQPGSPPTNVLDNFSYTVPLFHNMLRSVNELAAATPGIVGDIEPGQTLSNYQYDWSGNLIKDNQENIQRIYWTADGKVDSIKYSTPNPLPSPNIWVNAIKFIYDGMGNRVKKIVYKVNGESNPINYTYYMRDAAGDVLAVYELTTPLPLSGNQEICFTVFPICHTHMIHYYKNFCISDYTYDPVTKILTINSGAITLIGCNGFPFTVTQFPINVDLGQGSFAIGGDIFKIENVNIDQETPTNPQLAEWHLYGLSGRIGIRYPEKDIYYNQGFQPTEIFARDIRWKSYPLTDHLGNIRATFSDMKLVDNGNSGFDVDLTSAASFYPFGMEIPGRTWNNGTAYRYGWGGHENDNEIKGDGNSITTHFRLNDPRVGRWFSMDPVTHSSQSPYVSMDNDPVNLFDPNGADVFSDAWNWTSGALTDVYNTTIDFLFGTKDSPLAPGKNGLINDIGDAFSSVEIESENIVTYFPPASDPTYFEDRPDYVPGAGYYGGNSDRNYFGEVSNYTPPDWELGFENLGLAIGSFGHEDGSPNYNAGGEITSFDQDRGTQNMVAPDFSGVTKWKNGKSVTEWIRSLLKRGAVLKYIPKGLSKYISAGKQARHLIGKSKGGYLNSIEDAQKVLDAVHSGEAKLLGLSRNGFPVYNFNKVTGTNVNVGAGFPSQSTNNFIIKGTTNPSVVPTSPIFNP